MELIENKDRKFGAARRYYRVEIEGEMYLFTPLELAQARKRATDNPEDVKISFWRRLFGL
jgi:hypothetical protein